MPIGRAVGRPSIALCTHQVRTMMSTWRMWLTACSAKKLNKGQEVMFEAKLTNASQMVRTYVMCDAVGMLT
jgi:hypothetical protein